MNPTIFPWKELIVGLALFLFLAVLQGSESHVDNLRRDIARKRWHFGLTGNVFRETTAVTLRLQNLEKVHVDTKVAAVQTSRDNMALGNPNE